MQQRGSLHGRALRCSARTHFRAKTKEPHKLRGGDGEWLEKEQHGGNLEQLCAKHSKDKLEYHSQGGKKEGTGWS